MSSNVAYTNSDGLTGQHGSKRGGRRGRGRQTPYSGLQRNSLNAIVQGSGGALSGTRAMATTATRVNVDSSLEEPRLATPTTHNRHFSEKRFSDAPISKASKAGITYEFMSDVQAATLDLALSGKDLLVQARTGTGKTIAFLLPAIEHLTKERPQRDRISVLVLSPTRELALQIEKEAASLLAHHPFKVQHAIGGTNVEKEHSNIITKPCDILIATPGRLLDHLRAPEMRLKLSNLKTIVYDEADRILDQGFKNDLDKILLSLPPKNTRQALLFSATVSEEIKKVAAAALRPGYSFVSTLLEDEVNTHEHVEQSYFIVPQEKFMQALIGVLMEDLRIHSSSSKVMVFFPTARQVSFATELLSQIPGLPPILEIHSRKTQAARTKAAGNFTNAVSAVLLSSDVAARGVDFPRVTLVVQVGLPASSEQYIHRLGRTARAGAAGRGILILSPEEQFFLRSSEITELGLKPVMPPSMDTPISDALKNVSSETKGQVYRAFLGYYNSYTKAMRMPKETLVKWAWEYAQGALGWPVESGPPTIESRTVGKMGLKDVPGLVIDNSRLSNKIQSARGTNAKKVIGDLKST